MNPFAFDIGEVVELGTQVAIHGTMRAGEVMLDELFEMLVGIAILIYEMNPG